MESYNHQKIEKKWKEYWKINNISKTDLNSKKNHFYCLDMFPYPSGHGLHVGHWRGYVLSDVLARTKKLQGYEVIHPMGFDSFGLPAENSAILEGVHPSIRTKQAIKNFTRQLDETGSLYDWDKSLDTSDLEYYKWTQWLFLQLYKDGLAYQKKGKVNWCPSCQTVLANEQVKNNRCERCDNQIIKKNLKQWYFKITQYAEELLSGLEKLDWPETIKILQTNWIGKSKGAKVKFQIQNKNTVLEVFTTRIDTIFGATFIAIAPENLILDQIVKDKQVLKKLYQYREQINKISDIDRADLKHKKTGLDIEIKAINPFTNQAIPIYVADYILPDYGSGVIMSVPAHDKRDFDFAKVFKLPIKTVISPIKEKLDFKVIDKPFEEFGYLIDSEIYSGMSSEQATQKMVSSNSNCEFSTVYRLRDWLVSRQRYWGAPIPIIYCEKCGIVPVDEQSLPVLLPHMEDFQPKGKSPLASLDEFVNCLCPKCKEKAKRETDTLDTFVDSSWYYFRYLDNKNKKDIFSSQIINNWMPVDQYIGGVEHATKHLLYSRFITKFLASKKYINFKEPFTKLFGIGLIYFQGAKMSKSKGNVINPDGLVKYYGTDALRGYEMFIGPNDQASEWSTDGINGIYRFLIKINKILSNIKKEKSKIRKELKTLVQEYTQAIESFKTNVALSLVMKFFNHIENENLTKDEAETILIILSPIFPFLSEELWHKIGHNDSIFNASWPKYENIQETNFQIPIQINGKFKSIITIDRSTTQEELKNLAINDLKKKNIIKKENEIKKIIVIPFKIVNFVI